MELGAVAVVVFGDFFPEEGTEAGVFVLEELLAGEAADEVGAAVGGEVEEGGHFFIYSLQVELGLGGEIDIGDEAEAGVAIYGGLGPGAEAGGGAFGGHVDAAGFRADGVDALGGPAGIDEAEAGGEDFFSKLVAAGGEELGADQILDREDGAVVDEPALAGLDAGFDGPVGLAFAGVGAEGEDDGLAGERGDAVGGVAEGEDGVFFYLGGAVFPGDAEEVVVKIVEAAGGFFFLEEDAGEAAPGNLR